MYLYMQSQSQIDIKGWLVIDNQHITLVCSDIRVENGCEGYVNDKTQCAWNNDGEQVELSSDSTCTNLADFQNICSFLNVDGSCAFGACAYVRILDQRIVNQENHMLEKMSINFVEYQKQNLFIELTNTTKLTKDNCGSYTNYNYHWTKDGKCEECADLISYDSSSEIIFGMIMMIYLVA